MPKKSLAAEPIVEHPIVNDSLQNLLTGMGSERDSRRYTQVVRSFRSSVSDLDTRFTESDLEHNIVAIPAEDMTREWVDLQSQGDAAARLEHALDLVHARTVMHEALLWSRLTGTSLVVVGLTNQKVVVDDDGTPTTEPDLSLPAQPGKVQWLRVFDRFEVGAVEVDEAGDVVVYSLTINDAPVRVHASRVLRFDADPMPRRMRDVAGWGLPVLERCREPIDDLNTAMNGVAIAMNRFSESVLQLDGLTKTLSMDKGNAAKNRISLLNTMRSVFGLMTLDATDKFSEVSRNFSSVPEMLDRMTERVASAARMPVALLMGRSPAGLNATGDADLRWWYAHVAALQEVKLRPALWRLIELLAISEGIDLVDEKVTLTFAPLWRPTQKEQAETHSTQALADIAYLNAGVVDPEEIRASRFSSAGYSVETVVDDIVDEGGADEADLDPKNLDENGDPIVAPVGGAVDIQKTAMSGVQVTAMQSIVTAVAQGQLPRDSGINMLVVAFQLSPADAEKVMGSAGKGFVPAGSTPVA